MIALQQGQIAACKQLLEIFRDAITSVAKQKCFSSECYVPRELSSVCVLLQPHNVARASLYTCGHAFHMDVHTLTMSGHKLLELMGHAACCIRHAAALEPFFNAARCVYIQPLASHAYLKEKRLP